MIRIANKNDIEQISDIKVKGWQTAYKGIIDSSYLNIITIESQIDNYSNHYDLNNIIVAEADNNIVGFVDFALMKIRRMIVK